MQDNVDSTSEFNTSTDTLSLISDNSDLGSSNESCASSRLACSHILHLEKPTILSMENVAFPLIMLLYFFRKFIPSLSSKSKIIKELEDYSKNVLDIIWDHQDLLVDLSEINVSEMTLDNLLDRLKKSEVYIKEIDPDLYNKIINNKKYNSESDEESDKRVDEVIATTSNDTNNDMVIPQRKLNKNKLQKALNRYHRILSGYLNMLKFKSSEEREEENRSIGLTFHLIQKDNPHEYEITMKRYKTLEEEMKSKRDTEAKMSSVRKEKMQIVKAETELQNYSNIFRDMLFFPYGSSTQNLQKKLFESHKKIKNLVPDYYDMCTCE